MMLLVISGSNSVLDKRQRFSETCKMFLYIYTHAKWLRLPVRQAFFFLEKHVLCVPRNTFAFPRNSLYFAFPHNPFRDPTALGLCATMPCHGSAHRIEY